MDPWTPWRGSRDTPTRSFWRFALLSLVLHFPLTPLAALVGFVSLLLPSFETEPPPVVMTEIPIELFDSEALAGTPSPPTPAAIEAAAEPGGLSEPAPAPQKKPKKKSETEGRGEADAGVPDAGVDAGQADAAVPDAGPPDAGRPLAANDAGVPDAGAAPRAIPEAGPPGIALGRDAGSAMADPVALAGAARRIVDSNSNVKLTIDTAKLRAHPLGKSIGSLLAVVPQWSDFFGPTGIDVVRDTDQILVTGPQLRRSGDVVAVIRHRLGNERMHEALDHLVKRESAPGEWLEGGVPIARATADRAPRLFAMASPRVVIVAPPHLLPSVQKNAKGIGQSPPRPLAGAVVVSARVNAPARAFQGVFSVPESIRWVSISVEPREDGGAIATFEAEDESPEQARENAKRLERTVIERTQIDLGIFGRVLNQPPQRFVDSVVFTAEDKLIRGRVTSSQRQIAAALDLASAFLGPPRPASAGSGRRGTSTPPATPDVQRR